MPRTKTALSKPTTRTPRVSVLMPVYNSEKYIVESIDSVLNQTFDDFEFIIINDGSTDNTSAIITEYASRDKRIKLINKDNEGYGKSMNRGLDLAKGDYISIVEPDDWIDRNMLQNLVGLAIKYDADIVKSNFYEFTTVQSVQNKKIINLPENYYNRVIEPRFNTDVFFCAPAIWSAVYRRDFLNKNNIRFLETPGASYQDVGFNFKALVMAKRAFFTQDAYLHYRCDNSGSSVKQSGKIFCVCDEWNEVVNYLYQRPDVAHMVKEFIPSLKSYGYMWNLGRLKGDEKKVFLKRFQQEYRNYYKSGLLNRQYFDDDTYFRLLKIVYPHNLWIRICRLFIKLSSPIYKTHMRNGSKKYRFLGFINVNKKVSL